jgi:hypothetical protein
MSGKVGKQDFEAYADHKPFNYVTNPVWEDIIQGILNQTQTKKDARECSVLDYGCGDRYHRKPAGKCQSTYRH